MGNLYEILGLTNKATFNEIKKRYRELVKQFHPDKNPSETAEDNFKKIQSAYETLSDSQKREEYDNVRKQSYNKSEPFNWNSTLVVLIILLVITVSTYIISRGPKRNYAVA